MNKKLIYGLCAASFLMTACDYNEDNFPGFDQEPLTDVVYYEGEIYREVSYRRLFQPCAG